MGDNDKQFEAQAFQALASCFYDVVSLGFRSCSPLMAEVARRALLRQGIECELVPCQFWYSAPQKVHVVGFVEDEPTHDAWDGHVICATASHYIDTAVPSLEKDLDVRLPRVLTGTRLSVRSQAIARRELNATERVWWCRPPGGTDTTLPYQIPTLVTSLADALHKELHERIERSVFADFSGA